MSRGSYNVVKMKFTNHIMAMPNGYAVGRIAGGKSSAKTSQETEPYPHCKKMFQFEIENF